MPLGQVNVMSVPHTGHELYLEDPTAVNKLMLDELERVAAVAGSGSSWKVEQKQLQEEGRKKGDFCRGPVELDEAVMGIVLDAQRNG